MTRRGPSRPAGSRSRATGAGFGLLAALAAAPAPADVDFAEVCTATRLCDPAGACTEVTGPALRFGFTEVAYREFTVLIDMPGAAPVEIAVDNAVPAYSWADDDTVRTFIYIYNSSFHGDGDRPDDPAEFVLTEAAIQGRLGDVRILSGTCREENG